VVTGSHYRICKFDYLIRGTDILKGDGRMINKIGKILLWVVFMVVLVSFGKLTMRAHDQMFDYYEEQARILIESKEAMERERYEHFQKYGTTEPVVIFHGNTPPSKKK
jgi:methylthioribose-1-phosphate isomerase